METKLKNKNMENLPKEIITQWIVEEHFNDQ